MQAEGKQVGFLEAALFLSINYGRPDLEAALMRARSEGGKNADVAVFCAGIVIQLPYAGEGVVDMQVPVTHCHQ